MDVKGVLLIAIIPLLILSTCDSANIVFFLGTSTYSHRIPTWPLAEALTEKGHNVTFVSPYPAKKPNPKIFDYVPKGLKEWVDSWGDLPNVFDQRKNGTLFQNWATMPDFGIAMCHQLYNDEKYLNWVKSSKVDLLFLDTFANDCVYGHAHYWKAKIILFVTTAPFSHFTEAYGLPDETSSIPHMELAYPAEMTFTQRLTNALIPIAFSYFRRTEFYPKLKEINKEKLGMEGMPKFEDIERNASMVFLNTHFGEEFPRALPPNVISIGGIANSEKTKPLPKELDEFLKKGDGFIYMSFGTYGDFFKMEKHIQQAFIGAMKSLPEIQFVWKLDSDSLAKEFPSNNVFIGNWMPQQDILAHPKIKGFITHAGLLGIQEAIHNSVPLISFPIFADQDYNAERIHRKEYGIRLEISKVTQVELEDAIKKIVTDPKYRNNMKTLSMLFKERPQKPLETALWWTEFVLRHSHEELTALRPMNVGQPWWKRRQLDVWAAIMVGCGAFMLSLIYLSYKIFKVAIGSNSSSSSAVIKKRQ